jgi:NAD-dependent dihydropyrimidine dehydrogenase PreA subunit
MTPMNLRYYTSAITLELDPARCLGCGRCVEVCPHDVFELVRLQSRADETPGSSRQLRRQSQIVHRDRCMECGACARNCAAGAIQAGAGVGCAAAIINGMVRGTAPDCDCGGGKREGACCATRTDCGGDN